MLPFSRSQICSSIYLIEGAPSVRGGDELPVLVAWRKRGKGRGFACVDGAAGKGWVMAEVVAGEEKRTGESKTMMGLSVAD